MIKYRAGIDGLRAVAVVMFHAFPSAFSGEFNGFDLFFIISSLLISSIIFKNLNSGKFSFSDFYLRRIKRIFTLLLRSYIRLDCKSS